MSSPHVPRCHPSLCSRRCGRTWAVLPYSLPVSTLLPPQASFSDTNTPAHVTIHGPKAEELLEHELKVKKYELRRGNFSETGNLGLGVREHIGRAVVRAWVARRKQKKVRIGIGHRAKKGDTQT
ncbi:hypothetical protein FIBSPDRAFT_1040912 [Athelia psychrophila]|uniref:Uncharacterized protein n=1 Tax=Athelia psychrophila TaxID=1759441 RepID=A0A166PRP2_9AGAM|nr:hypothetical protein FIBSPDRAFT_1040912 [Fibularhizoctonia sp. CBS 109695]